MAEWLIISFIVYFTILLTIGLIFGKKQTTSSEFIGGGRQLNYWLTALNAHASDMSVWALMGFPAAFYLAGVHKIWMALGLIVGMYLNWHFVAKKLRIQTEKFKCYTLSSYFEARFNDSSHVLRILTGAITVFFLATYISAGFIAMGYLFEDVFGMDYSFGLIVSTLVILTYIYFGGYVAIAHTDFFQGMLLLFAIIIVPLIAFFKIDGWDSIISSAQNKNISLSVIPEYTLDGFFIILSLFSWGLGYFGQPHIITKFMGIKNPEEMPKAKILGITWQSLVLFAGMSIGLIGISFFSDLQNPEMVFIEMTRHLIFTPLVGFVLCAVIAANMSTVASQILVCGSALSEDFARHVSKKESSISSLTVSRICMVFVAFVSLSIALTKTTSIMTIVQYAWTGLGCSFGPVVIAALYSRNTTRVGAIAGICFGAAVSAVWPLMNGFITSYSIPAMLPAFFGGMLTIYFVSRFGERDLSPALDGEL